MTKFPAKKLKIAGPGIIALTLRARSVVSLDTASGDRCTGFHQFALLPEKVTLGILRPGTGFDYVGAEFRIFIPKAKTESRLEYLRPEFGGTVYGTRSRPLTVPTATGMRLRTRVKSDPPMGTIPRRAGSGRTGRSREPLKSQRIRFGVPWLKPPLTEHAQTAKLMCR